jgi:hypothetical protein
VPTTEQRLASLEGWRNDLAEELRDWEEWVDSVRPFLVQLQADLIYRQRRHAESVGSWSLTAKVVAWAAGVALAVAAVGSFVVSLLLLSHGATAP